MRNIANYITLGRIILTICLLFTSPLSAMFYTFYIICGISDMADGVIARKLKIQTDFGARFDTIADFLFLVVTCIKILPIIEIKLGIWIWVFVIALLKLLSMGIIYMKHNTFGIVHTYLNKITGFLLFISPLLLKRVDLKIIVITLCIVSTITVIEEFIMNLVKTDLDLNRKSLFR